MSAMKTSPTQAAIDHMNEAEQWARIGCYNTAIQELRAAIEAMKPMAEIPFKRAGVRCQYCGEVFKGPNKGRVPSTCSKECRKALSKIEAEERVGG